MQPATYGPFPFLPITRRKKFEWPGGARVALWVVPNIEFFHLDHVLPGNHNERVTAAQARIPSVRNWAVREYGNRVGVWRLMDVLTRYGIRGTVALNSDTCIYQPEIVEAAMKLGWEFIGHGQTNAMRLNEMEADREKQSVHDTLKDIAKVTGRKPRGWLGAGLSETWNTLDFLVEEGVEFVADWTCDDLPFRMAVAGRMIFSIPYTLQANDTPQLYEHKLSGPDFGTVIKRQFDCLYQEGAQLPRVMAIALHPFVTGVPYRIGAFEDALEYICRHAGVWLATGSEIIDHYARAVPED
jgi:peptidoglycan/xylan/chitin deacetylase (PgdA/CDA1 family)